MAAPRHAHRLIEIHQTYTVEELAERLGINATTVRNWQREGLQAIDTRRPTLFHGHAIASFLKQRRVAKRRTCGPDQIYCMRCRRPQVPADRKAAYHPRGSASGFLVGTCPQCGAALYRRVSAAGLAQVAEHLDLGTSGQLHIGESTEPFVNPHFRH